MRCFLYLVCLGAGAGIAEAFGAGTSVVSLVGWVGGMALYFVFVRPIYLSFLVRQEIRPEAPAKTTQVKRSCPLAVSPPLSQSTLSAASSLPSPSKSP